MKRKNRMVWLLGALALAAAGGSLALWVERNIESYEAKEDVGYRGAARLNPFLAAELLLDEMGLPTVSRFQRGPLPSPDHSLVIFGQDTESQTRLDPALLEWVGQGGHLVVVTNPEFPSPLLEVVGIALKEYEPLTASPDALGQGEETTDPYPQCIPDEFRDQEPWTEGEDWSNDARGPPWTSEARQEVALVLPGQEGPRWVRVAQQWTLFTHETGEMGCLAARSSDFCPFARVSWGTGSVTALVDGAFMTNREIGDQDHAAVTFELLQGPQRREGAVFVIHATAPGLWKMLWQRAWMVIITAALLLACWVWQVSRRFGPLHEPPPPRRRSLLEHIEATGTFLWRQGQGELLLESTRQAVRRRLASRLGTVADQEEAELEQAIVDRMGERPSLVRHAFHGHNRTEGESRRSAKSDFLQMVKNLERLWSKR